MRKKAARTKTVTHTVSAAARATELSEPQGLLIALELGSEFPRLAEAERSARRVLTQLEGEAPAAFAERVTSSLETLFERGVELRTVALACNERVDAAADSARRSLVGLVLGAMARQRAGKVYLTASARSSGRTRQYLSALAQGALEEWSSAGLEVSLDFGPSSAVSAPRRVA